MTTPATILRAKPANDLATELSFFVERMCWPVSIDTRQRRLVARADANVLDALRVRHDLAEPLAQAMAVSLMFGPIHRGEAWWTFITAPSQQATELPADLRRAPIRALPRGGEVVLPPVTATAMWRNTPQPGHPLPPWSAIVALARSVIYRRRMTSLSRSVAAR